jgi:acyl-CoA reductase-like NAD-dependent aldehyde dehydrogenase
MLHIPVIRGGVPYTSVEQAPIIHHATGEPVAMVSQANAGMIVRDVGRMSDESLEQLSVVELFDCCRKAAELFLTADLPIGDELQSYDAYIDQLSATTGMPIAYCHNNAKKIHKVLADIDVVVRGLTRGLDPNILDSGYGEHGGSMVSFFRAGRVFGAVLPNNSPGVHSLWIPAVALKAPIVLKPGSQEPWTPYRIVQSLIAAGAPREAFGLYPSDHAGALDLLRTVDRAMVFGDANTTKAWANDPRVEIHGPGFSKVILGDDVADDWESHLDLMESSIAANGGRSCINASAIWTPKHGREIADALGSRFASAEALPVDDPNALLAAFVDPAIARRIDEVIDRGLSETGAQDLVQHHRGSPRLVEHGRTAYLLPTVVWCEDRSHALANREFLFPFASVVECPTVEMPDAIGPSLIVTAITQDQSLIRALMASPNVDRLNIGPLPTWQLSWDQPHEGNLFEHLYRQRAFQIEPAA